VRGKQFMSNERCTGASLNQLTNKFQKHRAKRKHNRGHTDQASYGWPKYPGWPKKRGFKLGQQGSTNWQGSYLQF